jgi:predicted naringenin-chalcone synthase
MPAWITALGHTLPGPAIPQDVLAEWIVQRLAPGTDADRARLFARRSGVQARHSVLDLFGAEGETLYPRNAPHGDARARSALFDRHATPLAASAARNAGVGSTIDPASITHVIVATCTGAVAPGIDLQLIPALGLRNGVRRTMVGFMGCYAAMPALRLARDTALADASAKVLVVCCELSSLHLHPGPADDLLVGAMLFGDGAAAAVIEAGNAPRGIGLRIGADACAVAPDSADQMAWIADAQGFELRLSPLVSKSLGGVLPGLSDTLLGDMPRADAHWLVHPGGPRILDAAEIILGLPAGACDPGRRALASAGNRSSSTVLAMLCDSLADTGAKPWSTAVMFAFGPGLTAEGLRIDRG